MEKSNLSNIKLTKSQKNVLKQILDFVNHPTDRVFILKGYAGTGKTTLMRFLIKEFQDKKTAYKLLASTGRAAKILSNLSGGVGATTIHSLIYSFHGLNRNFDDDEKPLVDKDGQLFLVFEPASLDEKTTPETIYIIDEASMVSDVASKDITQAKFGNSRLLKEFLEYDSRANSKFIFVGDPCQLPPIEEYYSPALMPSYFSQCFGMHAQETQLTEIMRQKGTSGIVDASKIIRDLYNQAPKDAHVYGSRRQWGYLPFRHNRDIELHIDIGAMVDDYVAKVKANGLNRSVCVCKTNKMCSQLSSTIRQKLGFSSAQIQKGDLLMVVQNNGPTGLMNGDVVVVEEIASQAESRAMLTFRHIKVKELFTGKFYSSLVIEDVVHQERLNLDSMQQKNLFMDFIIRMKKKGIQQKNKDRFHEAMYHDPYLNALRCVFGYAITCHKSQGGEWDDVYVHVPRNITMNPTKGAYQWIYTAMTRARKTLHMVDDFFIQ